MALLSQRLKPIPKYGYQLIGTLISKNRSTYSATVFGRIVMTIYIELRQSTNSDLLNVRHEVVRDALWIFTNFTTLMSPNRVEVSQQDDSPTGLCFLNVSSDLFQEKLYKMSIGKE